MKISVFGENYAAWYDYLYADKDYAAECQLIEEAFRRLSPFPVRRVLDAGCGTGNHAWRLAQRGYQVVGVDLSRPMLHYAMRKKATFVLPEGASPPLFVWGDMKKFHLHLDFDAAVAMFAVLGYQSEDQDVVSFLRSVSRHLKKGGLFLADMWYGPAVETLRPETREKIINTEEARVVRQARAELLPEKHLCLVHYRLIIQRKNQIAPEEFKETHVMRYFFPEEIENFLTKAGLQLARLSAFAELDQPPGPSTWNILMVAQKS